MKNETIMSENGNRSGSRSLYVGIDAGSVSLNGVVIDGEKNLLYESPYLRHVGRVEEEVLALLQDLYRRFDPEEMRAIAFTGNHGKKIAERLGAFYEFETITQVLGALHLRPDVRTIISMGGQDTALFQIRHPEGSENGAAHGSSSTSTPTVPAPRARAPSSISRPRDWRPPSTPPRSTGPRRRSIGSSPTSSGSGWRAKSPPTWPAAARFSPSPT